MSPVTVSFHCPLKYSIAVPDWPITGLLAPSVKRKSKICFIGEWPTHPGDITRYTKTVREAIE